MRRWSGFFHVVLNGPGARLHAVLDQGEESLTLWLDNDPMVAIHLEDKDYRERLAAAINRASDIVVRPSDPGGASPSTSSGQAAGLKNLARRLHLIEGGAGA